MIAYTNRPRNRQKAEVRFILHPVTAVPSSRLDCRVNLADNLDDLDIRNFSMEWKLAEAKNRLSELVTRASTEGPQTIRRHNAAVVVVDESDYRALVGKRPSFKQLLLAGPSLEGVIPSRDPSPVRKIEL
jgi:antitoxin Phd